MNHKEANDAPASQKTEIDLCYELKLTETSRQVHFSKSL